MTDGPRITYITSLPYSGSSLLALALGNADGFVNCGEMNYLENDYHEHRTCSCGALLQDCPFWGPLIEKARAEREAGRPMVDFSYETTLHPLYARKQPLGRRIALILGRHPRKIYGAASIDRHVDEQVAFMRLVLNHAGAQELVDASKNVRRLRLLNEKAGVDLRVIVLSRNPAHALGAKIKRARRRTRWYRQVFAPVHVAWLLYHSIQMRRVLSRIAPERVLRLRYEDFVSDPEAVERRLGEWYGRPVSFGRIGPREIDLAATHVYTGNSWLTKGTAGPRSTQLREPQARPELTRFELAQFRVVSTLLPVLRQRP